MLRILNARTKMLVSLGYGVEMFEYKTTGQDTGNVRGHLMLHHENFG